MEKQRTPFPRAGVIGGRTATKFAAAAKVADKFGLAEAGNEFAVFTADVFEEASAEFHAHNDATAGRTFMVQPGQESAGGKNCCGYCGLPAGAVIFSSSKSARRIRSTSTDCFPPANATNR